MRACDLDQESFEALPHEEKRAVWTLLMLISEDLVHPGSSLWDMSTEDLAVQFPDVPCETIGRYAADADRLAKQVLAERKAAAERRVSTEEFIFWRTSGDDRKALCATLLAIRALEEADRA